MKPGAREGDLRIKVLGLRARFVLAMTGALAGVLVVTALLLWAGTSRLVERVQHDTISAAVRFTHEGTPVETETKGWEHDGVQVFPYRRAGGEGGLLFRHEMTGPQDQLDRFDLYVPASARGENDMLGLIGAVCAAVLLAGAAVSLWVASSVTRPVGTLIDDVRHVAKGDLRHRTRARGPGEIQLLARALDRMTADLLEARETEVELSVRERELEVAAGVREALLPATTPIVEGYDLGSSFLASPRFGGDFHDFVERADGQVGLLVCDVGGRGVPAALVGATARSYLRAELLREEELADAFARINRFLAGDMRRGMFVSALYALLDPVRGVATVACAGHKIPLLRLAAAEGSLRVVHPEGIALGFDKGPVFERRLQVVEVPIEPGDRLLLANSAPVRIESPSGEELGEKAFYARVKRCAMPDTPQFLRALRRDLEQFAGEAGFQEDLAFVSVTRNPT